MKKRLIKALAFLPEGQGIYLGDDTFLTGLLDGSDKIYGFAKLDGVYVVVTGDNHYKLSDIDNKDLKFIFNGDGTTNIYDNIKSASYRILDLEEI